MIAKTSQVSCSYVRADQVELVVDPVERPVSYEDEHEVIFRAGVVGDGAEGFGKLGARRLVAGQGIDMGAVSGCFEQLVQVFGVGGKALIVVRFPAKAGDGYVIDAGVRGQPGKKHA